MSAPALNSLWAVRALLAIETGSEDQARDIASQVFQQMDVVFERPPAGYKSREQIWTIAADIDLSGLPVIEPDTARIRVNYVKRNLGSVTWRVARSDDRHETQEWPPGFWAQRAGFDDVLAHPAIRADQRLPGFRPDTPGRSRSRRGRRHRRDLELALSRYARIVLTGHSPCM